MAQKSKRVTFDTMVRFFLMEYDIPTSRDIKKIETRIGRLEKAIKAKLHRKTTGRPVRGAASKTAWEQVLDVIREHKDGVRFAEIKMLTGFDEKKIRNIIFRLDKEGKIIRIARGLYVASS